MYIYIYILLFLYLSLYLNLYNIYIYLSIYLKGLYYHREDVQPPSQPWTKPEYTVHQWNYCASLCLNLHFTCCQGACCVAYTPWVSHSTQHLACENRCFQSARHCGAKHISKSKCTKHTSFGPLLEVAMSKKCTPLWREAHFEVKMLKTHQLRTTFGSWDVEKVHGVVARSTFRGQNVKNIT